MPYTTEKEALNDPFLDRRVKMLPCQKEMAFYWYNKGYAIRAIAKIFKVDRTLITFLIFPERKEENLKRRAERGGSKIYYNKESHKGSIKQHRSHKHSLLKDITPNYTMAKEQSNKAIKGMDFKHLLDNYMTVERYAAEKQVVRTSVYHRIGTGDIVPVVVGRDRLVMIDWEEYKDVKFKQFAVGKHPRKPAEE